MVIMVKVLLILAISWVTQSSDDYYTVLGLTSKASVKDIKKAYRQLAISLHPDKLVLSTPEDKSEAQAAFVQLAKAYEVLSDSKVKKRRYDHLLQQGVMDYDESRDWSYIDQNLGIKPMHHREGSGSQKKGSRTWSFEEAEKIFESSNDEDDIPKQSEDMPILYQIALVLSFVTVLATPFVWSYSKKLARKTDNKLSKESFINQAKEVIEKNKLQEINSKESKIKKASQSHTIIPKKENLTFLPDDTLINKLKWIQGITLTNIFDIFKNQSPSSIESEISSHILESFLIFIDKECNSNSNDNNNDDYSIVTSEILFVIEISKLRKIITGSTFMHNKLGKKDKENISIIRRISALDLSDMITRYLITSEDGGEAIRVNKDVISRLRVIAAELEEIENREEAEETKRQEKVILSLSNELLNLLKRAVSEVGGRLKGAQGRGAALFAQFKVSADRGLLCPAIGAACLSLSDFLSSPIGREKVHSHLDQEGCASDLLLCETIMNVLPDLMALQTVTETGIETVINDTSSNSSGGNTGNRIEDLLKARVIAAQIYDSFLSEDNSDRPPVSFTDTGGDLLYPTLSHGQLSLPLQEFLEKYSIEYIENMTQQDNTTTTTPTNLEINDFIAVLIAVCEQSSDSVFASFSRFQSGVVRVLGDEQKTKDFQQFARVLFKAAGLGHSSKK
eukprot:gene2488-4841_t